MSTSRRDLIKTLSALSAAFLLKRERALANEESESHASNSKRPNLLVFLTDDHGQWLQQAYGNSEVRTPNMERIAHHGVCMTNAYTTCPVCSPARASFFTGRMPSQHGIHDWIEESKQAYAYPWLKGQTLLSELLKAGGYHTGLVGKWHCGEERDPHPGFDYWFSYWVSQYPHDGTQNFSDNGKHVVADGFQSPILSDHALEFIQTHFQEEARRHQPFFLFVGYTDTHGPHAQMPDEFVSEYKDATFRDIPHENFSNVHGSPLIPVSSDIEAENTKRREYYAAASSVDREVGKLLDALDALGQTENTIIVYTSDHGLNAGHHGMWEKGNATMPQNFLEESIRVPCLISWPRGGIPSRLESDLPVNHCDLFATLLDAAEVRPDEQTQQHINSPGHSYLRTLQGKSSPERSKDVICEYGNARMIKCDGYKLILRYPYGGVGFPNELYDLKADPRETTNLYEEAKHMGRIQEMTDELNRYFAKYSVPSHDGLRLEQQALATPDSPWLKARNQQDHHSSR